MRKQVEMLQTDIDRRVEDEARLQRLNAQLRERLEMYQSQNRENIDKAEEELISMQKELESAMKEQLNAKAESDLFKREKDILEKRLRDVEADWEKNAKEVAMRIGSLEKGLTGKDRDIVTVHAERMKLEQDKKDIEKEHNELTGKVTEMRERILAAEEENNFLRQKVPFPIFFSWTHSIHQTTPMLIAPLHCLKLVIGGRIHEGGE
jgi:chromosome segregation ATPase